MSKKTLFILVLTLLIAAGTAYWFLTKDSPSGQAVDSTEGGNIFPFGNGATSTPAAPQQGAASTMGDGVTIDLAGSNQNGIPRLRRLSSVQTAGVVAFDKASTTVMRHVERSTGHIYETTSSSVAIKISTITIPKVHEALWAPDGQRLLMRYLKEDGQTIRTFYAKIATTTKPEQALEGMFLSDGIRDAVIAGNKLFTLEYGSGGVRGILSNLDGSTKVAVFNSSHSDWGVGHSASASRATVFSRPSAQSSGAAYSLNLTNGEYSLITSDVPGLTALVSPDGSRAIASGLVGTTLKTVSYDLKTGASTQLSLSTLTDKCVWSSRERQMVYCAVPQTIPNGSYPDDWYKGRTSLSDGLWRIDTVSGMTENLMTPELEATISMDMIKLSLDQDEETLVFLNKNDMTAWAYRLKE